MYHITTAALQCDYTICILLCNLKMLRMNIKMHSIHRNNRIKPIDWFNREDNNILQV